MAPQIVFARGDTLKDLFINIFHDQKGIATSPARADRNDLLIWGTAGGGALTLAPQWDGHPSLDRQITDQVAPVSGSRKKAWEAVSELASGEVLFGVSAVGYGWGSWQDNARTKRFTARWLEALADSTLWGTALKLVAGRDRPGTDPYQGDFHGPKAAWNSSFPSGHTTAAFTTAAVFSQEFHSPWVTIPAYTIATGVGVSRVALEKHWTSDVIVGAALGQSVGTLVMNRDKPGKESNARWTPWMTAGAAGLNWTYTF